MVFLVPGVGHPGTFAYYNRIDVSNFPLGTLASPPLVFPTLRSSFGLFVERDSIVGLYICLKPDIVLMYDHSFTLKVILYPRGVEKSRR